MGAPRALALCHCFGGALNFQTGRWDEAERALREAIDLYRQVGSASGESLSLQRLGLVLTARGETEAARELLVEGLVIAERAAMRSHCLTRLHASMTRNRLAAGDSEGTLVSLEEGLEAARRHGHCVTCNALLLPEAVRAGIARGDLAAADGHASKLEEIASQFESRLWSAMATRARARVLLARGEAPSAAEAFDAARRAFLAVEQHYEAARSLLGQAASLRASAASGEDAEAGALEAEAQRVFRELGAAGVED